MKLYEIDTRIAEIFDNAEITEDGEVLISEKMAAYLDELEEEKEKKIENLIKYYKDLLGDAEKFKAEIASLTKSKKSLENEAEALKKFLDYIHKGEKKSYGIHKISYRKSEVLEGSDTEVLPFNLTETIINPLKSEIKKALKEGAKYEGWSIKSKQNIQIK